MKRYSRIIFLDWDRCLGNTDLFSRLVTEYIAAHSPVVARAMRADLLATEARGESFQMDRYLLDHMSSTELMGLIDGFVATTEQRPELCHDGATEFVRAVKAAGDLPIILSRGGLFQAPKIKLSGFQAERQIVIDDEHPKRKGQIIADTWDDEANIAKIMIDDELVLGRQVVLVDDKASEFAGLPIADSVHGFWLLLKGEPKLSQAGVVPPNVEKVTAFQQIQDALYPGLSS